MNFGKSVFWSSSMLYADTISERVSIPLTTDEGGMQGPLLARGRAGGGECEKSEVLEKRVRVGEAQPGVGYAHA